MFLNIQSPDTNPGIIIDNSNGEIIWGIVLFSLVFIFILFLIYTINSKVNNNAKRIKVLEEKEKLENKEE